MRPNKGKSREMTQTWLREEVKQRLCIFKALDPKKYPTLSDVVEKFVPSPDTINIKKEEKKKNHIWPKI